jgi:hypothetical protein
VGTWRRPKGSYVRPTGDFFIDRAATVGGFFVPSALLNTSLDLYNNATDGSNLHVYRLWVHNDAETLYFATRVKGHGATLMQNAVPVVVGAGALPGQLYYDTQPQLGATFPVDTPLSDAYYFGDESGFQAGFAAPGPLAVILPGFSFRVQTALKAAITGNLLVATFYFVALPDTG